MKKICIVLVLFCAFFQLFADDDDKIKLAVMEFEDMSAKQKRISLLTQRNISALYLPARTATSLALKTAIDKLVEKIVKVETEVNGEIASQEKPKKQKSKAPSSNSKDAAACEYARQKDSSITWKTYIDKYPNGECAEEAFQKFEGDINQEAAL